MRSPSAPSSPTARPRSIHAGMLRNEDGAAAIEFAMLALPFLMFVLGVIGMGLYFFMDSSLQYAVSSAARKIRTGEVNTGGANGNAMTVGQFRNLVCTTGTLINCDDLAIMVQHATDWSGLSPQSCLDSKGNMSGSTGATGDLLSQYSGGASDVVLVTLCYKWDLAQQFGFLKLGSGAGGTGPAILQATAAFKSEPYN